MKTLTYGTLPTETEFYAAFEMFCGDYYSVRLNERDTKMLVNLDLDLHINLVRGRADKPQLYALCEALVAGYEDGEGFAMPEHELALAMDWAGEFCSSILETLGFEWV